MKHLMQVIQKGRLVVGLCVAVAFASGPIAAQQPKANILFILADNIGYGDIGAYGGGELRGAPTPRIDRLGAVSLRLTQFLVEPGCTPSRAALMTRRYSIRSGLSLIAVAGSPNSADAANFCGLIKCPYVYGSCGVDTLLCKMSDIKQIYRGAIIPGASVAGRCRIVMNCATHSMRCGG